MKKHDAPYHPVLESAISMLEAIALRELEAARTLAPATPRSRKDLAREAMAVARSLRKIAGAAVRGTEPRSSAA